MSETLEIEVIVSHFHNGSAFDEVERYSVTVLTKSEEHEVLKNVDSKRQKGMSVVVRPIWNDDEEGTFHDWRSFDGEPFKHVEFSSLFSSPGELPCPGMLPI